MKGPLEREIKLRVGSARGARASVVAAGGTLLRERRPQTDALIDRADNTLRNTCCSIRGRVEPDRCFVTYKGEPQPAPMKVRQELETGVEHPLALFALFVASYRSFFEQRCLADGVGLDGMVFGS
jgi:adenylate cyclase class IV